MLNILDELKNRGMFSNITSEEKFNALPSGTGVYIGFDPSADSLHLGNYIQIALLRRFQTHHFKAIAILGGATGMIGDPSGKSKERPLHDELTLRRNKVRIKAQLEKFGLTVLDNYDWYKKMTMLTFLREIGKLVNVGYMLSKESVKTRIETGLSFTEFSYQLIQGYDFYYLFSNHDVKVQLGGSDQWGNITTGIEIIHKKASNAALAVGITTNLLTTSSGEKFGKSAGNAIWLDAAKTAPFAMYQYLLNTDDRDVEKLLFWLTMIPTREVTDLLTRHNANPSARLAQVALAKQVVTDIHGKAKYNAAQRISQVLFGSHSSKLSQADLKQLDGAIPTVAITGGFLMDVLVETKIFSSRREMREFIQAGALEVAHNKVTTDDQASINFTDRVYYVLVKKGKKQFFLLKKSS